MVNLPAKAGDMGSDTGRFSCVKALAEGQLSCREVLALQKNKNNSAQSKDGAEGIFSLPHARKYPPTEKGTDE